MTRDAFLEFTRSTLEEVLRLAERETGLALSRDICFRWWTQKAPDVCEHVAEHIVARVFVDEEHIYPCVDIGVGDILPDGRTLIVANVAGYGPRPFGPNWKGLRGPYIHIVAEALYTRTGIEP